MVYSSIISAYTNHLSILWATPSANSLNFYSSSSMHLLIPNYQFVSLLANFSNTSYQKHAFKNMLHIKNMHKHACILFHYALSYNMYLPNLIPVVKLLPHTNTFWIYNQSPIAQHTFWCSPMLIPLILFVYHDPFTSPIRCYLWFQALKTFHFLGKPSFKGSPFPLRICHFL